MRVKVQKWGNSLALRVPKPFAEDAEIQEGTTLDLSLADGKLVAVPGRAKKVTLKRLLAGVRPDNLHGEVDTAPPVGQEMVP